VARQPAPAARCDPQLPALATPWAGPFLGWKSFPRPAAVSKGAQFASRRRFCCVVLAWLVRACFDFGKNQACVVCVYVCFACKRRSLLGGLRVTTPCWHQRTLSSQRREGQREAQRTATLLCNFPQAAWCVSTWQQAFRKQRRSYLRGSRGRWLYSCFVEVPGLGTPRW